MNSEVTDISTREEARTHDVRIGAKGDACPGEVEHRRITELLQNRGMLSAAEGRQKKVLDEFSGQSTATAVTHHDRRIVAQGEWA